MEKEQENQERDDPIEDELSAEARALIDRAIAKRARRAAKRAAEVKWRSAEGKLQ